MEGDLFRPIKFYYVKTNQKQIQGLLISDIKILLC